MCELVDLCFELLLSEGLFFMFVCFCYFLDESDGDFVLCLICDVCVVMILLLVFYIDGIDVGVIWFSFLKDDVMLVEGVWWLCLL